MSFGKMNTFIDIISIEPCKDSDGFAIKNEVTLYSGKAYFEERHGSEKWANRAVFSDCSALFRFRKILSLEINLNQIITCIHGRFEIISIEDVKGRGMYIEVLAKKVEASG